MEIFKEKTVSPLQQGVKLIGIGKHGSKKLPDELIVEINKELKQGKAQPILIGAFVGALMMKEIEPSYFLLEEYLGKGSLTNASALWDNLCADAPVNYKNIGVKLISKQTLTKEEAIELGKFLFSDQTGETFRGMAVSILRIRYESDEEYKGLYNAIEDSAIPSSNRFKNKTVIQLAEPFDGVEHSFLITPLIANALQKQGYEVIVTCGNNSGPKITLNIYDLYKGLNVSFIKGDADLGNSFHPFGYGLDQKTVYPQLDKWVNRRRIIMKRPFLSTLEKVLNPVKANILITSVFHIPYLEKMVELGIMAGFDAVIVLKRGLEGSLAPSLTKATGILCAVKKADGSILSKSIDANTADFAQYKAEADAIIDNLSLQQNIEYINQYIVEDQTGNLDFDNRVKFAIELYKQGLQWIEDVKTE
jgi:anthranilate phosphoribosyltransferase